MSATSCTTAACDGVAHARGMCVACYARWRRNGTVIRKRRPDRDPAGLVEDAEFLLASGSSIESVVQRLNVHPMTLARAYRSQGIVAPYGLWRLAAIHRDYDAR